MTVTGNGIPGIGLCAIFAHRAANETPDRYIYSRERMLPKNPEYGGTSWPIFFGAASSVNDSVPVYLKSRKDGSLIYYKLALTEAPEGDYQLEGNGPLFWGFNQTASVPANCPLMPVYEHGVPANFLGYPRYYYDLSQDNQYGWTQGEILCWAVAPRDYVNAYFDDAVKKFFEEDHCPEFALQFVPGMAVAVIHGDKTSVLQGYGVRSVVAGGQVDANTIFQLASVSKPVTSTVVAALVGKNFLRWEDPALDHDLLSPLRGPGSDATPAPKVQTVSVADLLAHVSGLPAHAGDMLEDIGYERKTILGKLIHLPMDPPGKKESYTNFGYSAAAFAATTAYRGQTGQMIEWEDLAKEQLYQAIGMTRTTSRYEDFKDDPNCAVGHQRSKDGWVLPKEPRNPDAQSPAGGVRSCVADLAKWMRLQMNNGMFEGKAVVAAEALAKTHAPYPDWTSGTGLGWNVSRTGDLGHSGAFIKGTATCVQLWPALGVGMTVLTNGQPIGVPEAVCYAFYDYLLGLQLPNQDTIKNWLAMAAEKMKQAVPIADDTIYWQYRSGPTKALKEYCNQYEHIYYGRIKVLLNQAGKLMLEFEANRRQAYLVPWDGDIFTYASFGENSVGVCPVEFKEVAGKMRLCLKNLHFSSTTPGYSEIDIDLAKESAWFDPV